MTLNEMAPPGREDQVKALKKKFPHDDEAPYKIAWAQHNRKKKKNVKEAVATAAATSPFWGPKALGLTMTGIGALGTYLQSRKKKEKKSDSSLLDAVRKKQAEIQQDVANKETLEKNKDFQKKEKSRGKYLPRMREPENKFVGEGASIPEHVNWMKDIIEDAPPGAKYERMVKHIKKSYKKDGKLTDEEKGIAYATAWKNYNNKNAK